MRGGSIHGEGVYEGGSLLGVGGDEGRKRGGGRIWLFRTLSADLTR